jgi:hypothetical protein
MKVRILRVPPARILEGVDLGPFQFERGHTYELESDVARVLVVWDYAERIGEHDPSPTPATRFNVR